jgi:O-antigen/teichoic acid export membrane protein
VIKNSRIKHWAKLILSFLVGQGSVQVINLLTGFFLLRWLSVDDFAKVSVVFGFQITVGLLVDVGFSNSITALVGDRFQDKVLVGKYVRSAQRFRNQLFLVIIPISAIVFYVISSKHNWSFLEQTFLFSSVIVSLFFQGWIGYYSSSLLMNKQISEYYKPQVISSSSRLVLCYILYFSSALSAWTNAWISTAAIAINGFSYRRSATNFLIKADKNDSQLDQEMFQYISPLIPGVIFYAFQGQISLFIITFFGQTKGIAEIAALGRLGQLFVLLGAFNGIVIEPYIAQISQEFLPRRYFQVLGIGVSLAIAICLVGFIFPHPLLWLLGPKYQSLELEVGWVVAGSCLNYVGSMLWTMNCARKWIYWWATSAYIITLLVTQISCLIFLDLSTTMGVVYFSLISIGANTLIHIATTIFGFKNSSKASII